MNNAPVNRMRLPRRRTAGCCGLTGRSSRPGVPTGGHSNGARKNYPGGPFTSCAWKRGGCWRWWICLIRCWPATRRTGVSRLFKQPFKASGRLRDAQVMLCDVERRLGRFPDAKHFKKELLRREKRLSRQLERKLRRTRLKPLKNRMDALRKELRAAVKPAEGRHRAGVRLLKGVDRAFANVVARRRGIAPAKPHAVHRTRIAFKKFRYMVEQLRPLMPGLAGGLPGKLRGHQKLMGDIQDCETLLAALDKFMREEKSEARRLRKFRAAVKRDHAMLMTRYLRRADELFSFWNTRRCTAAGRILRSDARVASRPGDLRQNLHAEEMRTGSGVGGGVIHRGVVGRLQPGRARRPRFEIGGNVDLIQPVGHHGPFQLDEPVGLRYPREIKSRRRVVRVGARNEFCIIVTSRPCPCR